MPMLPPIAATTGMKKASAGTVASSVVEARLRLSAAAVPPIAAAISHRQRTLESCAEEGARVGQIFTGAGHLEDVLGGLLPDHVDDVVDLDDPDEAVLPVDHGQRDQVVAADDLSHFLLVGVGLHRAQVGLHDVGDALVGPTDHELTQRAHADQMVVAIRDVNVER